MKLGKKVYCLIKSSGWGLLLVLWLLGAANAAVAQSAIWSDGVTKIQTAQLLQIAPDLTLSRTEIALPYRWDFHHSGESGTLRVRAVLPSLPLDPQTKKIPRLVALYIPRVGNQVVIYINGIVVGHHDSLENNGHDESKQAMRIEFSSALLDTKQLNYVDFVIQAQSSRWGGLSEVYFGLTEALAPAYWSAVWWQKMSYVVMMVFLIAGGILSAYLWWQQREHLHNLFFLSAVFGVVAMADKLSLDQWLPWPWQGWLSSTAHAWYIVFMARFAMAVVQNRTTWVRLAMLMTVIATGIAYLLREPMYTTILYALLLLPLAGGLVVTVNVAETQKTSDSRLLALASFVVVFTAMRDFFVVQLPESGMNEFSYIDHALFLYVLVMFWVVMHRYVEQHKAYQDLNATLEQRVQAQAVQLTQTHWQLQQTGQEQARLLERQRIMQDIHDGVGGQLVGLLGMIKRTPNVDPHLQEHAQMALDELRVAVDAMQPVDGDLATVLATLRYRLAPRLKAANIELVWQIDELPVMEGLTPQKVLQIQKILLEAFTNIIQHAKAAIVTINAKSLPDINAVQITIEDDGVGFEPQELNATGHGIRNMCFRAEAIGALITFQRLKAKGVTMTLTMPVI